MSGNALEATVDGLRQLGLIPEGADPELVPLTGGVASDIWLVRLPGKEFVVKRALEKLRVAADWRAPISRNASEVAWLKYAAAAIPSAVPTILAHSPEQGFFAMSFLPPDSHPVWKRELQAGHTDPAFAARVGKDLACIHASTAGRFEIAPEFNDDALFRAIRLEPYLDFTAGKYPEIAGALQGLIEQTIKHRKALVHGDVSPKNILVGPDGPVFLDAECAWFGDPAFDLAFCLNHLLLKCLWTPTGTAGFLESFDALQRAYLADVKWEPVADLEARVAALLPALLLARIDGKSPVEYVTDPAIKDWVRGFAVPLIATPRAQLSTIRSLWADALPFSGKTP